MGNGASSDGGKSKGRPGTAGRAPPSGPRLPALHAASLEVGCIARMHVVRIPANRGCLQTPVTLGPFICALRPSISVARPCQTGQTLEAAEVLVGLLSGVGLVPAKGALSTAPYKPAALPLARYSPSFQLNPGGRWLGCVLMATGAT
jgi:hypothetical protein